MNNIKGQIVIFLLCMIPVLSYAQEEKSGETETNYVWIDTFVTLDSAEVRLVSNEITITTCCLKSPKYSRVSSKAAKWIRKNFDPNYEGNVPFKTLQNQDLAITVINAAKEKAGSDNSVRMIDYEFKCE